jgi:hypothetical protein
VGVDGGETGGRIWTGILRFSGGAGSGCGSLAAGVTGAVVTGARTRTVLRVFASGEIARA